MNAHPGARIEPRDTQQQTGDSKVMNSAVESSVPSGEAAPLPKISLFRMYMLRVFYFVMAAGIGVYYWPAIIHHTSEFATTQGVQYALLAGLGAVAALGLRYPVQMLPILLFELTWKAIYLLAFALPLWSAGQITAAAAADIQAVLLVVFFIPCVPWRYVFA